MTNKKSNQDTDQIPSLPTPYYKKTDRWVADIRRPNGGYHEHFWETQPPTEVYEDECPKSPVRYHPRISKTLDINVSGGEISSTLSNDTYAEYCYKAVEPHWYDILTSWESENDMVHVGSFEYHIYFFWFEAGHEPTNDEIEQLIAQRKLIAKEKPND